MENETEKNGASGGKGPSFWSTMPGILSGIAALLTALAGLIAAASAAGLLAPATPTPAAEALVENALSAPAPTVAATSPAESTLPPLESTAPASTTGPLAPTMPVTLLEIEFVTGDASDAGTQDDITLSIDKQSWKWSDLSPEGPQPGSTQRYTLPLDRPMTVEKIKEVKVCKEKGKDKGDNWYLQQVAFYVDGQLLRDPSVEQWLDSTTELCWREDK